MTGAEFAELVRLKTGGLSGSDSLSIAREFDTAVAELTAERDEATALNIALVRERNELRYERDSAEQRANDLAEANRQLSAALARVRSDCDTMIAVHDEVEAERDEARARLAAACKQIDDLREAHQAAEADAAALGMEPLADRLAAMRAEHKYLTALEAEHEAIAELDQHEALACVVDPPCGSCDACTARIAHATVEALRGDK